MNRKLNIFKQVPAPRVKRNLFDLSHEVKMSGKFGYLYPIMLMDVVPGDTVRNTTSAFMRFAPLLAPIMHRCDLSMHAFFVPNRLLTDHWEAFITGGKDGTEAPVLPYVTPAAMAANFGSDYMREGSLWDYLGLPIAPTPDPVAGWSTEQISALPFRACAKVWNDYYRDPNLTDEMDLDLEFQGDVTGGCLSSGMMNLYTYRRAYEKDYFTSALPFAQRGAQVLIPMEGSVSYYPQSYVRDATGTAPSGAAPLSGQPDGGSGDPNLYGNTGSLEPMRIENIESIENTSVTINDLRRSFAIQRWLENNARGGPRYTEQILSHFDVQVPDYRLQRAEYLGGGKQVVQISEVLAAAGGDDQPPVGDMAGHGLSAGRSNQWTYRCQEHGWIVMFLSVTFKTAYQQGIHKMWSRRSKFDFAWPELANLGEQEIVSKEVLFSFNVSEDEDNQETFGYIPRYAEYKYAPDRVAGAFRSSLAFWHLGRIFTSRPTLSEYFTSIYEEGQNEESARRVFAVQDGTDYLWMQLFHHCTVKRPLPYFGVPSGL